MDEQPGPERSLAFDLATACANSTSALDMEGELRKLAETNPQADVADDLRGLAVAFGYYPTAGRDPYWGPMMTLADGRQYPLDLDQVDPALTSLWISLLEGDVTPLVAARLGDLLWSRRESTTPFRFAQQAIDAYLALASQPGQGVDRLYRVEDATRALHLATELNDRARIALAAECLLELAGLELAEPSPAPGVALGALAPLVPDCPPNLESLRQSLLVSAISAFSIDPFNFQSANEIYAASLPLPAREPLFRSIVARWQEAATSADGLTRLLHLERAIELAKLHDLSDVVDGLRVKAQQIEQSELGMERVRSEVEIASMDEMLSLLVRESWADTLRSLGSFGPPSGTRQANLEAREAQRLAAPIQAIISRTKLGFANAVIWRADAGTPERERLDVAEIESFRITYSSYYFMAALAKAAKDLGEPVSDEIIDAFTTPYVSAGPAKKFARGLELYLAGDYELAGLVLLPSIEACVRHLNNQAGLPVTVEPRGAQPGGVKTLGGLLSQLGQVLDRDWLRYLENVLTDPLGHNLRNRALHGLMDGFTQSDVSILIHVACFLSTLRAN